MRTITVHMLEEACLSQIRKFKEMKKKGKRQTTEENKIMKKIKFRAWDKYEKYFVPDLSLSIALSGHLWYDKQKAEDNRFILMRYTGLKDKNDKEIYEEDIVKEIWVGERIFKVNSDWDALSTLHHNFGYSGETWEVIGNIYENPEIIKIKGDTK